MAFHEPTEKLVAQRVYFDQGSLLRQMQASNGPSKKAKKKIKIRARRRAGTVRRGRGLEEDGFLELLGPRSGRLFFGGLGIGGRFGVVQRL